MTILKEFREHPQRVLDRLVDGELGVNERRQLLAALDDEPGAWRQCALAFLEAQSWGWQLSRMASEPIVAQIAATPNISKPAEALAAPVAHDRNPHTKSTALWSAALAASVLVAFVLGTRAAHREAAAPLIAEPNLAKQVVAAATPVEPASSPAAQSSAEQADQEPLEILTFKPYGRDEAIEVPLVPSNEKAALAAAEQPSAISGALVNQFARDGFVVDRQQRLLPMELPDGRSVLVPVEEVNIQAPETQKL